MIYEISVALIAAAFVVLVLYLIFTLRSLIKTLNYINATLAPMQRHAEDLCEQTEDLLNQATVLTEDLHKKLDATNGVFNSISNLGERLEHITEGFKPQKEPRPIPINEILEWGLLGYQLWQKFKNRRE